MARVLIDTNVLLRSIEPHHPAQAMVLGALAALRRRGDEPCIAAQNIVEFRAVCTRPMAANGLGLEQAAADAEIARLMLLFTLLPDDPATLDEWRSLVSSTGSVGKQNHDARLVAAMSVHGVRALLTLNPSDFRRYGAISVLTPDELAKEQP